MLAVVFRDNLHQRQVGIRQCFSNFTSLLILNIWVEVKFSLFSNTFDMPTSVSEWMYFSTLCAWEKPLWPCSTYCEVLCSWISFCLWFQYVEKLDKLVRFCIKERVLTLEDLDRIWAAQDGKHDMIVKNVHDMLVKLAWDFSPEQLDHLFGCFQVRSMWFQYHVMQCTCTVYVVECVLWPHYLCMVRCACPYCVSVCKIGECHTCSCKWVWQQ